MNPRKCGKPFQKIVGVFIVVMLMPLVGRAQTWKPDKSVDIIIGTSPGGPQDRQGRLLQRILQERKLIDQTSSVSNRPGGGVLFTMSLPQSVKAPPAEPIP